MSGGDARHAEGRRLRRGGSALVVLVLVAALAAHVFSLGPRWLGWDYPSPVTDPAKVAPPPGLTLPTPGAAPVVASAPPPREVDPAAVRRALRPLLRDKDLGRRVAVAVAALPEGATAFSSGPATVTPASTTKVLTTAAALAALGPDHTFRTTVVAGAAPRDIVLVGGGDPLLARAPSTDDYPDRADLATLAARTARSLKQVGRLRVRLGYDTTLFSGPTVNPAWPATYTSGDVVSPISPLWVDEGRERPGEVSRADDPALAAADVFAQALAREGIAVVGRPRPVAAPGAEGAGGAGAGGDAEGGAVEPTEPDDPSEPAGTGEPTGTAEGAETTELGAVASPTLSQIAQWVLETSDNEAAEVLFRQVAVAEGQPGSFDGGAVAVRQVLERLGVDTGGYRLLDGSGLARGNRLAPATLLDVLTVASSAEHPDLRTVATGLPVAGFTGSLTYRFDTGADEGLGMVRAKTGTLTGVHGLAGLVTDADGLVLTFVAIADRVAVADTLDARERLDQLAAALAACRCAA